MQIGGFTQPKAAPSERATSRSFGRRFALARPAAEQPEYPNRAYRRRALALAPRHVRELVREHKRWPKGHWLSIKRWLSPEELEQSPEALAHAARQIKNAQKALRRKCRAC